MCVEFKILRSFIYIYIEIFFGCINKYLLIIIISSEIATD